MVEQLQPLYLHSGVQDVQGLSCVVCCGSEAPEDCESHSKGQFLPQIVYSLFKQDRQKVKEQSRFLLLLCCCFFFFLPTVGEMWGNKVPARCSALAFCEASSPQACGSTLTAELFWAIPRAGQALAATGPLAFCGWITKQQSDTFVPCRSEVAGAEAISLGLPLALPSYSISSPTASL